MAIPKKGARKIMVNGHAYRWAIRSKPTYSQGVFKGKVTAGIELFENPGSVLSVIFPWVRYDNWLGIAAEPVTPKHIEKCIEQAIAKGWHPEKKGRAFKLSYEIEEEDTPTYSDVQTNE